MNADTMNMVLIVLLGVVTYGLRVSGYLVLARISRLNLRVEAALDAVPVAVITALVAPVALVTGAAESIAAMVTVVAAFKLPILPTLVVAAVAVTVLRAVGL